MPKAKTSFFCQNCGAQYPKWQGQCASCKEWNTLAEEVIQREAPRQWENTGASPKRIARPLPIPEIEGAEERRIRSGDLEWNRVLGGGMVPGSVILLGGEPGIGKSTLLLQLALQLPLRTLYVSGEESPQQIKMRAERIDPNNSNCYVLAETNTQRIFAQLETVRPHWLVIDSIQTLHSDYIDAPAGGVAQIRTCAGELIQFAKETATPVVLVGHITKEGTIAGPKILEHIVDTVLQFEGDRNHAYRILRALKNRFGATSELGIYEMQSGGLRPVSNPSEILLSKHADGLSGTAVAATLEGLRPLLIEIQALVSSAVYGTPQRSATGYNAKRLNMLLAVLEKRAGFRLGAKDVFLNVTGGITVDDPAIDLAVVAAILSSNEDLPIPQTYCFAAEVGLGGEIRPVQRVEQRISEAEKLGFTDVFLSRYSPTIPQPAGIRLHPIAKIEELVQRLFG